MHKNTNEIPRRILFTGILLKLKFYRWKSVAMYELTNFIIIDVNYINLIWLKKFSFSSPDSWWNRISVSNFKLTLPAVNVRIPPQRV